MKITGDIISFNRCVSARFSVLRNETKEDSNWQDLSTMASSEIKKYWDVVILLEGTESCPNFVGQVIRFLIPQDASRQSSVILFKDITSFHSDKLHAWGIYGHDLLGQ